MRQAIPQIIEIVGVALITWGAAVLFGAGVAAIVGGAFIVAFAVLLSFGQDRALEKRAEEAEALAKHYAQLARAK